MRLEELLAEYLPPDDPRSQVPASRVLLTLVRNVLISREPIYGVGEWAQGFAPDVLNLWPGEVVLLHDDRLGICLDRLFAVAGPGLILAVVRQVVREFDVRLDELHNDSTTVTFHGKYDDAEEEGQQGGRPTHAITWGHNKDHRPDLKQLLYILTVSDDGGVPGGPARCRYATVRMLVRRAVIRPVLFRPPDLVKPSVRDLTGRPFHSSERSISTSPRWPGVVGLYDLSAMLSVFRLASARRLPAM